MLTIVPYGDLSPGSGDVVPPPPVPGVNSALMTLARSGVTPFRDGAMGVSSTLKLMPFRDETRAAGLVGEIESGRVSMMEAEALRWDPLKNLVCSVDARVYHNIYWCYTHLELG